jgi:mono/diheme cytochrome c family protein
VNHDLRPAVRRRSAAFARLAAAALGGSALAAAPLLAAAPGQSGPPPAAAGPGGAQTAAELWKARCSTCHGLDGKGRTRTGKKWKIDDFTRPKWQKAMSDDEIRRTIEKGVRQKRTGKVMMPAFGKKLTPEEIDSLVGWVRSLEHR